MNVFDQAARFAADADPVAAVGRVLQGSGLGRPFHDWFDTRTVPMPGGSDRTADLVAVLEGDPPTLLVFEFQSRHDAAKLAVTLEEVAALHSRARVGERECLVLAALVYLTGVCPNPVLALTTPTGFGTLHRPLVWNVEQDDAAETLGRVEGGEASWGMLFWVPLMAGADDAAVVERWKQAVGRLADERRRSNLVRIALVFAELKGRLRMWQKTESWETESQVVNGWIRKSVEDARLTDAREVLIRVLISRFSGGVPAEVLRTIDEQPSLAMLRGWFDAALAVASMDEFVAVLRR